LVSVETPPTGRRTISPDASQEGEIGAARKQAVFRAVNEKIRAMNDGFTVLTGTFTVACECADSGCLAMLEISVEAYDRVRASPYTFVVLADHVDLAVGRAVAADDSYVILELLGADARRVLDEAAAAAATGGSRGG
jgi:hypothetical protein